MKSFIFTDQNTYEQFSVVCEPYQVHNIETTNEQLSKWVEGRILRRSESENDTAHLCKCNNCDTVMIDESPQSGAKELELTGSEVDMEFISEKGGGGFWACPVCKTDAYLTDLPVQ